MYPLKNSTAITVTIFVHDVAGDAVTGLIDAGFTKRISKNGAAFAAMTVTITEMENGFYSVPLGTGHTDTDGVLTMLFTHGSAKQVNLQYRVHARIPDDLAFPTVVGRSIDVEATGEVGVDFGNILGTLDAADIGTGAIDADSLATDAVTKLRSINSGTATSGSTTTLIDTVNLTEPDTNYWQGHWLLITSGSAIGQVRLITAFTVASNLLTFSPPVTQAITTNTYEILPTGALDLGMWRQAVPLDLDTSRVQVQVGAMQADVLDAAAIATDAVTKLRSVKSGTATSGSTTTLIDTVNLTEADTDYWEGCWLLVTSGSSSGQVRIITAFFSGTNELTFTPALTQAITTNTYEILPAGGVDVQRWRRETPGLLVGNRVDSSVGAMETDVLDAAAIATGAIDADSLASDVSDKILGAVTGTATGGSTTTLQDTVNLDQADTDYWVGSVVVMTSGNIAGQARRITAFNFTTDTITVDTAFTQAVVAQDFVIIKTAYAEAPAAGSGDWTAGERENIRDALGVDGTKTAASGGDVQDIQSRIPAALVGGAIDADVSGIQANAIDSASIEFGAITNSKLASSVISSSNFTAGAINAAAIATGAIDADSLADDAVTKLRSVKSGTASSGTGSTLVSTDLSEPATDHWKGAWLLITSGAASGEVRLITGFVPASDEITFAPGLTLVVTTETFEILPAGAVNLELWRAQVPAILTGSRIDASVGIISPNAINAASFATDAIDAAALAADAVTKLRSVVTGTADSGTTTTMVDAARTEADNVFNGALILFTSGALEHQTRLIVDWNDSNKTITFTPAVTAGVTTETYEILTAGGVNLELWRRGVPGSLLNTRIDANVGAMQADVLDAAALATDAVNEIRDAILPPINTAYPNIAVLMVQAADGVTGVAGLTLGVTRSIDGSVYNAGTGTATEISNGAYQYDASADDMNGKEITFRFTGALALDTYLTVTTGG